MILALTARPATLTAQPVPCALDEVQKVIPLDATVDHRVGSSVSISGERFIAGAWGAGAAYVFRRSGNAWVQEAKLTGAGGLFGWAAAISGDRAAVGARLDNSVATRAGATYVFRRDDNGTPLVDDDDFWVQEDTLSALDAANGDELGGAVAVDGDRIIAGAQYEDENGDSAGSAYVFRKDDNNTPLDPTDDFWVEEDKLIGSDTVAGDNFGTSVSISSDRAVVGAWHHSAAGNRSGAAYVFRRDDNGTPAIVTDDFWIEEDKLVPGDAATFDEFGVAVAIDGDRIVVGAWFDDDGGNLAGSAYVFRRDDNGTPSNPADDFWVEEAKLTASDATAGDELGKSVSIDGDRAVVGAFEDDDACADDPVVDPNCDSGSAYVFERDDNGTPLDASDDVWTQTVKLVASDTAPAEFFGRVAIEGTTVVVGSLSDEAGDQAGAVYVYDVSERCPSIPTVSRWGMVVMALFLACSGTVAIRVRRGLA